ncbi:NADP-dependent oxidoreductase domain-containing protein [Gilbertella persicaria]|uniref:NADP-dependent oxidoreductase domain-containing protein n=1 Tax=Gilbertella persicaria TaxID=101096 RepID=UPI00222106C4|nr:NADP-dependent oxidoreductase domain-containing protein [Gilbertella persicaria]KAI8060660.1 NADP-dependent oxidoreductase domain-containing protein [Gilbertella persicaria]
MSFETKMKYTRLGNTGLKVSKICLGCMGYGNPKWSSTNAEWVKGEKESIEAIKQAYNVGINFFDTADVYSNGESERVLGKALKELNAPRSRVVIATKVFFPVYDGSARFGAVDESRDPDMVNNFGLSRKHIMDACDASLKRLGVDYIDLYQIHRLDTETPMEEIMEALNDLVRAGKVRYLGCSSVYTWQFAKMNHIAEKNGWAKFVSMQNLYNLLYREEEREMAPYCLDAGIGWIPWSPLASGELLGKNRDTQRAKSKWVVSNIHPEVQHSADDEIIDRVAVVADKLKLTRGQVAIAWQFTKPYVTAPIVGISKIEQLYDLIGALDIKLSEEDVKYLEEPYVPKAPII